MDYIKNGKIPSFNFTDRYRVFHHPFQNNSLRFILEMMAAGKPVICTNVGSVPDFMINGKNGI